MTCAIGPLTVKKMSKGVTLEREELQALKELLNKMEL